MRTGDTGALPTFPCLATAGAAHGAVAGASLHSNFGQSLAIGDVVTGGRTEIIAGAPAFWDPVAGGPVVAFAPDTVACSRDVDARIYGHYTDEAWGASVAAGDVDGDGQDDLLVGDVFWNSNGAVLLFLGPIAPGTQWEDNDALLEGDSGSRAGMVSWLGDVTGDGEAEIAVGASFADNRGEGEWGRVALLSASAWQDARLGLDDATATIRATEQLDGTGGLPTEAADLDGDGQLDVAVPTDAEASVVYLFRGPVTGDRTTAEAEQVLTIGQSTLAMATGSDVTGDGLADTLLGAPLADGGGRFRAGQAWVAPGGPLQGALAAADLPVQLSGDVDAAGLGRDVAGGDFDGDGQDDLAVGVPGDYYYSEGDLGRVLIFLGPVTGPLTVGDAAWVQPGEVADAQFGFTLAAGDLDGDARTDLVVGAPYDDQGNEDGGKVYTFLAVEAL